MSLKFCAKQDLRGLMSRSSLKRMVSRQASSVSPLSLSFRSFMSILLSPSTYPSPSRYSPSPARSISRRICAQPIIIANRLWKIIRAAKTVRDRGKVCVFTPSSQLKFLELILDERPEMKYRDTDGIAAFVGLWLVLRSSCPN
jgi:hypothetical protein